MKEESSGAEVLTEKNVFSKLFDGYMKLGMKMYISSLTLNSAGISAAKGKMKRLYKAMETEDERKKLLKIIDGNINGLKRYWKRNTKSILPQKKKIKEKMYTNFIDWLGEFKVEVKKKKLK